MEINELEKRLHDKAEAELIKKLRDLFRPIFEALPYGTKTAIEFHDKEFNGGKNRTLVFDTHQLLSKSEVAMFNFMIGDAKKDAVDKFMREVNEMRSRMDELIGEPEQHTDSP